MGNLEFFSFKFRRFSFQKEMRFILYVENWLKDGSFFKHIDKLGSNIIIFHSQGRLYVICEYVSKISNKRRKKRVREKLSIFNNNFHSIQKQRMRNSILTDILKAESSKFKAKYN